jgi:hypothetical protein
MPLFQGCGGGVRNPVDPERAREALKTTLESWKKGESMDSLQSATPSIVAQDSDWRSGAKLTDFEVAGDGKPMDANLRVAVKLTLRNKQGKEVKKSVNYLVTTSPAVTVFRDFK